MTTIDPAAHPAPALPAFPAGMLDLRSRRATGDMIEEHDLGWCNNVGQLRLGEGHDDGDSTAPERHGGGFVRCSAEDDHEPSMGWNFAVDPGSMDDREADPGDEGEAQADTDAGVEDGPFL